MTAPAPWPLTIPASQAQKVACPFCDGNGHRCDQCEGDGWLFADEVPERPIPSTEIVQ